ncbi:3-deoxy-D-manno-octulosonic acid kinase [Elongatibacter sediminis]|uniref:3-deoxy-D-manno-octulosonic acid kinase n=1 Tax=Elongatibacter sediminis TaxID=3119006 RepID=A0AAW9RHQ2_9GAMM
MKISYEQSRSRAIVYDANRIEQPDERLFEPRYWREQGAIRGQARGRGSALMLDTPFGPAVLRQYLRGGQVARFSRDRYIFTGYRRSRPMREVGVLAYLVRQGLPVPRPLGAICRRYGPTYQGALITRRIEGAEPLADVMGQQACDDPVWATIGVTIRRMHEAGVVHADLNARNILVAGDSRVYLLDFDRAVLKRGAGQRYRANLERLKRSLVKCWPSAADGFEECWTRIKLGYSG